MLKTRKFHTHTGFSIRLCTRAHVFRIWTVFLSVYLFHSLSTFFFTSGERQSGDHIAAPHTLLLMQKERNDFLSLCKNYCALTLPVSPVPWKSGQPCCSSAMAKVHACDTAFSQSAASNSLQLPVCAFFIVLMHPLL